MLEFIDVISEGGIWNPVKISSMISGYKRHHVKSTYKIW